MRRLLVIGLAASGCLDFNREVAVCPPNTQCGRPPPASLTLAAELLPPAQSSLARQEVGSIEFDQNGLATIHLAPRVTVTGTVYGDADLPIDAAQVIVARGSLIPGGQPVTIQTMTAGQAESVSPGTFSFTVAALDGASYTISVVPQPPYDRIYAPASWPLLFSSASPTQTLTLCLGNGGGRYCKTAVAQPLSIGGRVADALDAGLAGVRVIAVDPDSGDPRSSVATTDGGGNYRLQISPNVTADQMLLVTATPDAKSTLPVLERQVRAGTDGAVDLHAPPLPGAQRFSLPIGGKSTSGADVPLAGGRVDFRADLSASNQNDTVAHFAATVITDDKGFASVDLIPGTAQVNRLYQVTVTPPSDSAFARSSFTVAVGPGSGGANVLGGLALGLRPLLEGKLVDPSGQAVGGAVVSAEPAGSVVYTTPAPADATVPMTVTAADGGFVLRVDPSTYDLELVPPPTAPLARWSVDNRAATDGSVDLGTVKLPRAVQTRVSVLGEGGAPASGVEVRVYAVSYADACPKSMGVCPLPARLRGDGTTAADGSATLLLPSP